MIIKTLPAIDLTSGNLSSASTRTRTYYGGPDGYGSVWVSPDNVNPYDGSATATFTVDVVRSLFMWGNVDEVEIEIRDAIEEHAVNR